MNNISIIGTGYVGLTTGACLSESGANVICMDIDEEKISSLKEGIVSIFEPGLNELVKKNIRAGRLRFTSNIREAVEHSTVIFIAVGTPPLEDGSADLQYVKSAALEIAEYINGYKVIVNKSTVPIGTAQLLTSLIQNRLRELGRNFEFDVVSNPEFLREGSAVSDFMNPSRIVIGTRSEKARRMMKKVYHAFCGGNIPFVFSDPETAELIKYASNAFLAAKISFINEISDLCEKIGSDICDVSKAIGMDDRIGHKFLNAGAGYGGSCIPKDIKALIKTAEALGLDMQMLKAVRQVNDERMDRMLHKIERRLGSLSGKTVCVLGLAFKPGTDDIRYSPAIALIKELLAREVRIKAYDPAAMENCRNCGLTEENITYCNNEYECAAYADALVLMTEWSQFKHLNLEHIRRAMAQPYFFDFRNVYEPACMKAAGFIYESMGRRHVT